MKTVAVLVSLSFLAGWVASSVRTTAPLLWTVLAWVVMVFWIAAALRLHTVVNAAEEER